MTTPIWTSTGIDNSLSVTRVTSTLILSARSKKPTQKHRTCWIDSVCRVCPVSGKRQQNNTFHYYAKNLGIRASMIQMATIRHERQNTMPKLGMMYYRACTRSTTGTSRFLATHQRTLASQNLTMASNKHPIRRGWYFSKLYTAYFFTVFSRGTLKWSLYVSRECRWICGMQEHEFRV